MPDEIKPLDATDITQIMAALQAWINGLGILDETVHLEYTDSSTSLGMCIKANGGDITEEDVDGGFSAEIPFIVYNTVNVVPDDATSIYKPLNDLGAWFKANGPLGLDIGERRTPDQIVMTRAPMDMSGKDESGNATFLATYNLTYDEEAQ
jgi:hypothetical protein